MKSKLADILPRLYLPLLILVTAGYAWQPLIGNDDFWAHAAVGRWMAEHGTIPNHTLFLWTANQAWIPHAWLSQWFFYQLMRVGGEAGGPYLALLMTVVLSATPWALIWIYYRRHFQAQAVIIPIFLMAIWVSSSRYDPRPELFTAAFLGCLFLYLLTLHDSERLPKLATAGILAMFVLWTNLHGAVVYGLVMLWITAIVDGAQAFIQRRDNPASRWYRTELGLALAVTVIIFACNPHGISLYKVLLPVQSAVFARIDEWKPLWAWPAVNTGAIVTEAILFAMAALLWAKSPNKRWSQLAWLLVMAFFLLKARRNLWLMAIVSLYVIAANAGPLNSETIFAKWRALSRKLDPKGTDDNDDIPGPMRLLVRVSLLVLLGISSLSVIFAPDQTFGAVSPKLPVKLADFVFTKTKGNLFNDYENSSYLEWRFKGQRPLYIDLLNVYPDSLMLEYFDVINEDTKYPEIFERRKVQTIAIRPKMMEKESLPLLVKKIEKDPKWMRVYLGKDGSVFIRR